MFFISYLLIIIYYLCVAHKERVVSTIARLPISRYKLYHLKKEFDKIYDLVLENSNRTEKKDFSDGTPYTESELNRKINEIHRRLNQLEYPVDELGKLALITYSARVSDTDIEKLIELYDREPIYMESILSYAVDNSILFAKSDYAKKISKDMSVDEILDTWFEVTAKGIENWGHRSSSYYRMGEKYGENFVKRYPDFFIDDKDLPREIKKKFYSGLLSIDEYEEYQDQFEGVIAGVGIKDTSSIWATVGSRDFTELLKYDIEAIKYFQKHSGNRALYGNEVELHRARGDIEKLKLVFDNVVKEELENIKDKILNGVVSLKNLKDDNFIRKNLPEFFLDDNAPEELKDLYNVANLGMRDIIENVDWIDWLEGKDGYIKELCIKKYDYNGWRVGNWGEIPSEVNQYMSLLYESELRRAIIIGDKVKNEIISDEFKERNSDIFFDDLPEDLRRVFDRYTNSYWTMEDIFSLPQAKKELLRGKQIYLAFEKGKEWDFCDRLGGDFGAFEIYEKYAGVMELLVNSKRRKLVNEDLEEWIQKNALDMIETNNYPYDARVPEEYKKANSQYFLDDNAPSGLKAIFYRTAFYDMTFELLREHPKYVPFLEGKSIKQVFDLDYNDYFNAFEDQEEARRLGIKYGDYVRYLELSKVDRIKEEDLIRELNCSIREENFEIEGLPEDFKLRYPDMFLTKEDLDKLSNRTKQEIKDIEEAFCKKTIRFSHLRKYPELVEIIKTKDSCIIQNNKLSYLLDLFDGDKNELIDVGMEYGDILFRNGFIRLYCSAGKLDGTPREVLDDIVYRAIIKNDVKYDEDLPDRFKAKHPELFLFPEELENLSHEEAEFLKNKFYHSAFNLHDLRDEPRFKEIIRHKNFKACAGAGNDIRLRKFIELLGDKDKAYNLVTGKLAGGLEKLNITDELDKAIEYYKEGKFIPNPIIVNKLPAEMIKGFVLNRKFWAKIIESSQNIDDEYMSSILEAAIVMGVFETKEFTRNGKVMIQGVGEKGYEKLQRFLNFHPRYFLNNKDLPGVQYYGEGYIKYRTDYREELIYELLEEGAKENGIIEDFVEGTLGSYFVDDLFEGVQEEIEDVGYEECFEETKKHYRCIVDRKIDSKIKAMFKMLGIKNDEILTDEEFEKIGECNRDYILQAFEENSLGYWHKDENGEVLIELGPVSEFKFNISQIDDKFVIGDNYDIDETQSKTNKKLFDYIRLLMLEYGLESDAARLGANRDRSNINLVLDEDKMETICKAADRISDAAKRRYIKSHIWEAASEVKMKYITNGRVHKIFDGLKLEYNQEFSEFLLNNTECIVEDSSLLSRINAIQNTIIEISKDSDYAGVEITPEIVLRATSDIQYSNIKVGFEKGEELAKKFAFDQDYFEVAQEVWEGARKRDASIIPRVQGKDEEYSYEVLRLDDVTGIYAGNISNCCQKLGGVGETAMLHSMTEKSGRVFIVRDSSKKIIAQSWLWRNGDTICFDNVEIPDNADSQKNQDAIYTILKKVAKELCDKDSEVVDKLIAEGKIDEKKGNLMRAKKVTVGKGYTDIDAIRHNEDESLEDDECKYPMEAGQKYKGIDDEPEELYVSDSRHQVILYKVDGYERANWQPTEPIHIDENIEKNCLELTTAELKMIREIEKEVEENSDIDTVAELVEQYEVEPEELNAVIGTDWFMLYSEKEEDITVHKMYKSPSSGIMIKSIKEQREAVKMLMDKGKTISMEFENDRVHKAAKSMVRHMQKSYTMKVTDEGDRMQVSEINLDNR